ncbi:MAG: hypothetical protein U9R32_05415 [Bacteroidota bacterium]|nr:hypothetical protein [Bacteroidota bacterium]
MRKISGILLVMIIAFLFGDNIFAQENSLRLELPVSSGNKPYQVCDFAEKGLLIYYRKRSDDKSIKKWSFWHYDNYFKLCWKTEVTTPEDFYFRKVEVKGGKAFFTFYNDKKKFDGDNLYLVSVDIDSKKVEKYPLKVLAKGEVEEIAISGDLVFIAVSGKKDRSKLYCYNLSSETQRTLQLKGDEDINVIQLNVDAERDELIMITRNKLSRRDYETHVLHYNLSGEFINSHEVNMFDNSKVINDSEYTPLAEEGYIITGTYIDANKFKPQKEGESQVSSGLFFAKYDNEGNEIIKFHGFFDFKEFYNYVYRENISSLRKIADKRDGDASISVNFQLLMHPIIKKDSSFILGVEAYYPEYHTERRYVYDYYGRMIPSYYTVFDGYRYTNAMIACFDNDGDLLWNNGVKIDNTLSYELFQRVSIVEDSDDLVLSYANEGSVVAKVIKQEKTIEPKDKYPVDLRFGRDILVSEKDAHFVKWYNEYYIYQAYQTIRNNTRKKNKRHVFVISKVIYE